LRNVLPPFHGEESPGFGWKGRAVLITSKRRRKR
jgi:hypothetical protein